MPITLPVAISLLAIGLGIGALSGMVGIGGGVIVIPILMFFFGFSQKQANGTSIAMLLPPIGVFAALSYYRAGHVNISFACLLAGGFALGAYVGAEVVNRSIVSPTTLRILFAVLLIYIAARILFRPGGRAAVALQTSAVAGTIVLYTTMRLLAAHLQGQPTRWGAYYRKRQREPFENDYEI
jgi:uncharacterized membrane protein YfcA